MCASVTAWSFRCAQTSISAVDTDRGPDHIAMRVAGPAVAALFTGRGSQGNDAPQYLAATHLGEGLFHVAQADGLGDELVQRQAAGQVQVDQHREIAAGQAVSVPGGL